MVRHAYRPAGAVTHACEPIQFGNGQSGRRGHETHHADAATCGTAQPMPIILKQRDERIRVIPLVRRDVIVQILVFGVLDRHAVHSKQKTKGNGTDGGRRQAGYAVRW